MHVDHNSFFVVVCILGPLLWNRDLTLFLVVQFDWVLDSYNYFYSEIILFYILLHRLMFGSCCVQQKKCRWKLSQTSIQYCQAKKGNEIISLKTPKSRKIQLPAQQLANVKFVFINFYSNARNLTLYYRVEPILIVYW